jgi:hypothetical protein
MYVTLTEAKMIATFQKTKRAVAAGAENGGYDEMEMAPGQP